MEQIKERIREMKKGLLKWYEFKPDSTVLYIGKQEDPLAEELMEQCKAVCSISIEQFDQKKWVQDYQGYFDYIVSVSDLETQFLPVPILKTWKSLLKSDGRMLLGMNNRLGIRYFCGDRDRYTDRVFDGIENYRHAYAKKEDRFQGRMYSQAELKQMLSQAGWELFRFYSVLPDLNNPSLIYSEDTLPKENLASRVLPVYHYPDSVFLEEKKIYADLIDNEMFHPMANAYLIECSPCGVFSDVYQVTSSMERGEDALLTILYKTGIVEKRAVSLKGNEKLRALIANEADLKKHGLSVVEATLEKNCYIMPYMDAEVGQVYLKRLLLTDKEQFLQEMDHFRDLILQSSEIVEPDKGDGRGAILRRGYLELVPLNSFYMNGEFVFFDQEFCEENYPANVLLTRMIASFYAGNTELQRILPSEELYQRYGLTKYQNEWLKMEGEFLSKLLKKKELHAYHERFRCKNEMVNSNRQHMNYSGEAYERLFIDIFQNADTRKLILFGSGAFAKKFLSLYQSDYPVFAIVDNDVKKWGEKLEGIEIQSPNLFDQLQNGEYKVIICMKNYLSVARQLDQMGISEYSIFDAARGYPKKRKPTVSSMPIIPNPYSDHKQAVSKRYHTGYIAGVFDLFHIGHLNLLKRAKEQCEYLIVGVVTDEGVRENKGMEPFISFEERMEIVRSCRYVDEAVEIPLEYCGTKDAWRLYHFDCQFSGSDYSNHSDWSEAKEFLEKHGSEMVFFSYTESTSSTKIKALIEQKLL